MAKRRVTPDELELWRHVAQSVRPMSAGTRHTADPIGRCNSSP